MKNFTFVHIPRTAGNSIVRSLRIKNDSHETAVQKKQQLGTAWNAHFKFTIIRNPWDRVLSWYLFSKQLRNITNKEQRLYKVPFDEWVEAGIHTHWETSNVKFNGNHPLNLYEYITQNDQIIVDFVGRYERLHKDFNKICRRINAPQCNLPHVYKTRKASDSHRKYYNDTTKKIVAKKFERDIELFKYTF